MTRVGGRRATGVYPSSPSIPYYFGYLSTATSPSTTPGKLIPWTTRTITDHFKIEQTYSGAVTKLRVGKTGKGMYEVKVNTSCNAGAASAASLSIYKNNKKLIGSTMTTTVAIGQSSSTANCNLSHLVYFEEGDIISINATALKSAFTILANMATFSLSFVPNRGWDNNSGGKLLTTGEVLR